MDSKALLALAERVEGATAPDTEIDALTWALVNGYPAEWSGNDLLADLGDGRKLLLGGIDPGKVSRNWCPFHSLPAYTASLDAAMTIYTVVPDRVPSDPRAATAEALRQMAERIA